MSRRTMLVATALVTAAAAVSGPAALADTGDQTTAQPPYTTMDAPEVVPTPSTAVVRVTPAGVEAAIKTLHLRRVHHRKAHHR